MASLFIEQGKSVAVAEAVFNIALLTEGWNEASNAWLYGPEYSRVSYSLEITVDDLSGEDGMPEPCIQEIPIFRANGGRHPTFEALSRLTVHQQENEGWDAWYGNDAPPLVNNRLQFRGWSGPKLRTHWEAVIGDHYGNATGKPIAFDGELLFRGLSIDVKKLADADSLVTSIWGAEPLDALEKHVLGAIDYGKTMPKDRRHWHRIMYWPRFLGPYPGSVPIKREDAS